MLEVLILLPAVFIVSYVLWEILVRSRKKIGPFKHIINALAFVGVIVHELSHFIMCKLLGVSTDGIKIKFLDERTRVASPHGSVSLKYYNKMSFMQSMMVSIAPLYISTWLFFWLFKIAFNPTFDDFTRVLVGLFCVSLLIGAAPSPHDLRLMKGSFKKDPRYSVYQIFLVLLSGLLVWLTTAYYSIVLPFDFLYFIVIGVLYFVFKYSFRGINRLILLTHLKDSNNSSRIRHGAFTRKRFKPTKPYKLGLEEPHW